VALGAVHKRGSAFGARYRRIMRHRGHKKAVVAVAHALLVTVYHVLAQPERITRNSGPTTTIAATRSASRAGPMETHERQGYRVTLERVA
jgi:hypothetical protein